MHAFLLISVLFAANPEENMRKFSFDKISFYTKKTEFLKQFDTAELKEKAVKNEKTIATYRIPSKSIASVVDITFVNENVGAISVWFTHKQVDEEYKGEKGLVSHLNEQYGEFAAFKDKESFRIYVWGKKGNKKLVFLHISDNICFKIKDIDILD